MSPVFFMCQTGTHPDVNRNLTGALHYSLPLDTNSGLLNYSHSLRSKIPFIQVPGSSFVPQKICTHFIGLEIPQLELTSGKLRHVQYSRLYHRKISLFRKYQEKKV